MTNLRYTTIKVSLKAKLELLRLKIWLFGFRRKNNPWGVGWDDFKDIFKKTEFEVMYK